MLYIYRVFKKKVSCIYGRPFTHNAGPFPDTLDALFRRQIIIPKALAPQVAAMIQPFSDDVARVIEAYPLSYHHAAVQEIGIGIALSQEKWEDGWPNVEFEELTWLARLDKEAWAFVTLKHGWTVEELAARRTAGHKMPRGMDKEAWGMLGAVSRKKSAERRIRKKMEVR